MVTINIEMPPTKPKRASTKAKKIEHIARNRKPAGFLSFSFNTILLKENFVITFLLLVFVLQLE